VRGPGRRRLQGGRDGVSRIAPDAYAKLVGVDAVRLRIEARGPARNYRDVADALARLAAGQRRQRSPVAVVRARPEDAGLGTSAALGSAVLRVTLRYVGPGLA